MMNFGEIREFVAGLVDDYKGWPGPVKVRWSEREYFHCQVYATVPSANHSGCALRSGFRLFEDDLGLSRERLESLVMERIEMAKDRMQSAIDADRTQVAS